MNQLNIPTIPTKFLPISFMINRIQKSQLEHKEILKCITLSFSIEILKLYNIPFNGNELNIYLKDNLTYNYKILSSNLKQNNYVKTMFKLYSGILNMIDNEYARNSIHVLSYYHIDSKPNICYMDFLQSLKYKIWNKSYPQNDIQQKTFDSILENLDSQDLIQYLDNSFTERKTNKNLIKTAKYIKKKRK